MDELQADQVRQVYLLTYSQADLTRFPSRETFSRAVLDAFSQTPANVLYWVCAKETHEDGGYHYHLAIKLDRVQRWRNVKRHLQDRYHIVVNFSNSHANYYTAWEYVTKEDTSPLQSDNHPVLENPPSTTNASQARVADHADGTQNPPAKKKKVSRLTAFQVGEICLTNSIKTRLQLLDFANKQRLAGKTDLAEFIFKSGKKKVEETMATAWEMHEAAAMLERAQLRRMDLLRQFLDKNCVDGCGGEWLFQAQDILLRNSIPQEEFAGAVRTLLQLGRGKYRNILITGPTNCGKSFILQPLTTIYDTFFNPATATYAWIGVETAEVILLNDFRWSPQVIIVLYFYFMHRFSVKHITNIVLIALLIKLFYCSFLLYRLLHGRIFCYF